MSTNDTNQLDPRTLVNSLDVEVIERRLGDVNREADALRVLLRAARARQRASHPEKITATASGGVRS